MAQAKHRSTEDHSKPKAEDVSDKLRSELHALLKASDALKVRAEESEKRAAQLEAKVASYRAELNRACPGKVW